jgi:hypothetical protein
MASHDDVCLPSMLQEYVRALDADPAIVLCYSAVRFIGEDGELLRTSLIGKGMAERPSERYRELSSRHYVCEPIYGLMRTDVLRAVRPHGNYVDSDRVQLCELGFRGRFLELPTPQFCKRFHEQNVYVNWAARMTWFNPGDRTKVTLPFWLVLRGLTTAVISAPVRPAEKLRSLLLTARWALRNSKLLIKDVVSAAIRLCRPRARRAFPEADYNWE